MIRSERTQNTLDEYFNSLRRRIETGNNPQAGVFLELCHFAELYRRNIAKPAEPGASRHHSLSLQLIDEIRAEVATIKNHDPIKNELLAKLEQLSITAR